MAVRSFGDRQAVLQGIVNQRAIDLAVMQRNKIDVQEVVARIPELEITEDARRKNEWMEKETLRMQKQATKAQNAREAELRRLARREEAIRQMKDSLTGAVPQRGTIYVAS